MDETYRKVREFELDSYLSHGKDDMNSGQYGNTNREIKFQGVCESIRECFDREWNEEISTPEDREAQLEREKNAIIGKPKEVEYFKDKIRDFMRIQKTGSEWFPEYYESLVDAVFHENWGIAGLAPWAYDITEELRLSSSAKIIGDNIFFLINGKYRLQPQKISEKRRKQLKKALLLKTPKERLDAGFHEVYMERGNIRITIFSGERVKEGQETFVFRKYVLQELTFEKMAELGTIPAEAIPVFTDMIHIGYNVMFTGAVRTGKSTFMVTWQKYEDPTLEGLTIATDPENAWDKIMPGAPIMQIVADDKELENITKSLLRGDNDYVIIEECRDATAFNIALDITTTGTRRSKMTVHANRAVDIPYKMGSKIAAKYGGNLNAIIAQVYQNWNYVFEFIQPENDKSQKRLAGISELRYDMEKDEVSVHEILRYDVMTGSWKWKYDIGEDKAFFGKRFPEEFNHMCMCLKELERKNPLTGNTVIYPAYYHATAEGGLR